MYIAKSRGVCLVVLILCAVVTAGARADVKPVTVFAAASLTNVYEAVGRLYRETSGRSVRFSFAASSTLAKQLDTGAPADIYVSADEQWMEWLANRGRVVMDTRTTVLGNQLVLITPLARAGKVDLRNGFDIDAVLGAEGRLAVGDPAHVPAGRYARQVLEYFGVWPRVEKRLVRGDNVRVALALVERAEVPAGIVYATDAAVAPKVHVAAVFPPQSHRPIVYPMAIVRGQDAPPVRDFFRFLQSEAAYAVYRKFGFSVTR